MKLHKLISSLQALQHKVGPDADVEVDIDGDPIPIGDLKQRVFVNSPDGKLSKNVLLTLAV